MPRKRCSCYASGWPGGFEPPLARRRAGGGLRRGLGIYGRRSQSCSCCGSGYIGEAYHIRWCARYRRIQVSILKQQRRC